MKVLILSCNTGEGHNSCAAALEEECRHENIPCDTEDALRFISPEVSRFISNWHVRIYRHAPGLFRVGYRAAEEHPEQFHESSTLYRYLTQGAETLGGFIAGIVVALVAGWVSRRTPLKEDASFAGFYLGSLALGVTLVSLRGSSVDLLHLLFGSILAVDRDAALFVSGVASLTLLCIALCYRGLVSEAFDSAWLQVNHRRLPALLHGLFLALLVLNLVAGFQVLGTLMAVGVMMLPAVAARCWARTLPGILLLAAGMGALCAWLGLSLSWAISLPAGPAIVLTASALFFVSLFFGTRSRLLVGWRTLMG